ncbi:TPA: type II secretion system protein [Vibrio parahaemolyticus]|uniref:prepilin-type N-terminal cleavage/methylation domain-containing protein n=1 Tax=Vibrio TaxID=662 RepID=UPI0003F907BC|nr:MULTISPECIES: type II secretion system protein [Vibrio]EJG0942066.1 type II secretion system protein [Vibrio parahaemolyticus O1]EGR3415006.1 type II secretion system protein [Vibrio parahaemolyticus]EHH2514065.1 type II secretion system protein [Vibrio parahaemolyticus]EHZ2646217.1 type II secretion system protein [Vibrio parahaemolyticus]EJE4560833.1 type II secretion system protein [Vibrio parahaemolyticus]
MKRQGGFTLIELVVVIVILGILAVTAAPRFLNLQDDARNATLEGLSGAIKGAAGIVYGKAAIEGVEAQAKSAISVGSNSISLVYGYPSATSASINPLVDGLQDGGDFIAISGDGDDAYFGISGYTKSCVHYQKAAEDDVPAIKVVDNDDSNVCDPTK